MRALLLSLALIATADAGDDLDDWPKYGRDLGNQRFSPLAQVDRSNVGELKLAWQYRTGRRATFQTRPIVIDGIMYLTTPYNDVIALDATDGREIWRKNMLGCFITDPTILDTNLDPDGDGLSNLPLADRATLGNMAPEFGSTCGIFPIDGETIRYMKLSGRDDAQCELVEAYAKEQGMWRDESRSIPYSSQLELDLGTIVPSLAGPRRPQDRIDLDSMKSQWHSDLEGGLDWILSSPPSGPMPRAIG